MTNLEIYKGAVALTGDKPSTNGADYEERAKVLLPIVCQTLAPIDRILKRHLGKAPIPIEIFSSEMDATSPLENNLYSCACHYLASELTAFEDADLSAELFVRAEALRRILGESIPFEIKKIAKS